MVPSEFILMCENVFYRDPPRVPMLESNGESKSHVSHANVLHKVDELHASVFMNFCDFLTCSEKVLFG